MNADVIAISGSPTRNSNTDRIIKRVASASGQSTKFVKLSSLNISPCRACLKCAGNSVCQVKDDFPALAQDLVQAKALILGCYPTGGTANGFSKVFLERLYCMGHRGQPLRGKPAVLAVTGLGGNIPGRERVAQDVAGALKGRGLNLLGAIKAKGNAPCLSCGHGEGCTHGALPKLYGNDLTVTPDKFSQMEDQPQVLQEADRLGRALAQALRN